MAEIVCVKSQYLTLEISKFVCARRDQKLCRLTIYQSVKRTYTWLWNMWARSVKLPEILCRSKLCKLIYRIAAFALFFSLDKKKQNNCFLKLIWREINRVPRRVSLAKPRPPPLNEFCPPQQGRVMPSDK